MDDRSPTNAAKIADAETPRLLDRDDRRRRRCYERAVKHLPLGVASSFQAGDPYPIYLARGQGRARLGRRRQRVPRLPRRLRLQRRRPRPPEDRRGDRPRGAHRHALRGADRGRRCAFAEELCRRFRPRQGALRQLGHRSDDGRDPHRARRDRPRRHREDRGLVPRAPRHGDVLGGARTPTSMGGREQPASTPMSIGIPAVPAPTTRTSCRSTTLDALRALLDERGDEIACLIIEPVMMNIGIVVPEPGYLEALRDLLHQARRRAHLRRGEVGRDDRRRRRDRALRRAARPRVLRQGDRRRHARRPRSAAGPT